MGLSIDKEDFSPLEYKQFSIRLYQCLDTLKELIQKPGFGQGKKMIGAELENYIVAQNGQVLPINTLLIEQAKNPNYTVELNRFNLEINLEPEALDATVFSRLQHQLEINQQYLQSIADQHQAKIVPIGILPTLEAKHLMSEFMTDMARYQALSKFLWQSRGKDFRVHISGDDEVQLTSPHVTLEGANTSFQFHLMVEHHKFAQVFNAIQLTTPLVLAIAANSPIFLGKSLWDETRIALFKQSIDSRHRGNMNWRQPSRVTFGHGWVRDNAWELFAETVALYKPIFPILSEQDPLEATSQGEIPKLEELSLHMGTTWPWNRPVYSHHDGGHVRIEMRAMPAGPSAIDMCANAAFATGLALGIQSNIEEQLAVMPFRFAEYNFYRAAQNGLEANILWPDAKQHQIVEMPISQVIEQMLPIAAQGLSKLDIAQEESNFYLGIIQKRIKQKISGARWQKYMLYKLEQNSNRQQACSDMLNMYMQQQETGKPVTEWPLK